MTAEIMNNSAGVHLSSGGDVGGLRFRKPVFPVPVVPVTIADSEPTEGAKQLLEIIRPKWPADRIRFTVGLCFSNV